MILATLVLLSQLQTGGAPPHPPGGAAPAEDNPQRELVERIRATLQRIDAALIDTAEAEDADVARGLTDLRARHEEVIRDLEELIKQAKYRQSNSSRSSSSDSSESSGSPSQQDQQARESDGSRSPDPRDAGAPQPGEQGESSEEEERRRQEQSQAEGRPEDGAAADNDAGENREGTTVPPDPVAPVTRQDVDGRWGLLPPKLQERLTNLHVDDVPERYRTWLEAYIRVLAELEQEPGAR